MTLKTKLTTAIATGAVLLNALAPLALADDTINITNNGRNSDNTVVLNETTTTTVVQSNNATVNNDISSNASTGNNKANDNSGPVSIDTGSATNTVNVTNTLNSNTAAVDPCNCENGDVTVNVSGNLRNSDNTATINDRKNITVSQNNVADVTNDVDANSKTGGNKANDNSASNQTGGVEITTGAAKTDVTVNTTANRNLAVVGGSTGAGAGSLDVTITGNLRDSDNSVTLNVNPSIVVAQSNRADVNNDVDADAKTGHNEAEDNSGSVSIDTGAATANIEVDNNVNFNAADVDCGCLLEDRTFKIGGNGRDSDTSITGNLGGLTQVLQGSQDGFGNKAVLGNDVNADAKTGKNEVEDNGSGVFDPSIDTHAATSDTYVKNTGNSNVAGHVELTWDPFAILGFFNLI